METDSERLILLKTRRSLIPEPHDLLRRFHPYDLPELTFVPITGGSEQYFAWLAEILA